MLLFLPLPILENKIFADFLCFLLCSQNGNVGNYCHLIFEITLVAQQRVKQTRKHKNK